MCVCVFGCLDTIVKPLKVLDLTCCWEAGQVTFMTGRKCDWLNCRLPKYTHQKWCLCVCGGGRGVCVCVHMCAHTFVCMHVVISSVSVT